MEEKASDDDDIDEILGLLNANGIKVKIPKKKQNSGIKILDDCLIYKPDDELLNKINENLLPENPDIPCITSCSTIPISTKHASTMFTNTSTHFVIDAVGKTDHLADLFYTQAFAHTEECITTTTVDNISSKINTVDVIATDSVVTCSSIPNFVDEHSTTTTAEIPSSYVVADTTAEVIAVPFCSNISTAVEATESSFSLLIEDVAVVANIPKRNKHALPEVWKKNVTKEKRMRGACYDGYARGSNKVVTSGIPRAERKMGFTCEAEFCRKSTKRFCSSFTEDDRQNIFNNFWKELDWSGKTSFVCSLIDKIPVKQKKTESVKRSETFVYYLKLNGEAQQVCKKMFLHTLGLKERMVFNWLNQSQAGVPLLASKKENSIRGKRKSTSTVNEQGVSQTDHLRKFLEDIPKLPSHYCRSTSSKLYLEPVFKSKSHLYEVYKQKCNEESVQPISSCYFDNKFEELNLSICKPKKDRCDVCCSFETKNVTQEEYDRHIEKKKAAREQKEADKKLAKDGKVTVMCMDMQSVKVCPKVQASAVYYKTKLCCHNFTIYNMATNEVVCYWWHECEGELQASNFASCLIDYIVEKVPKSIPLIIYSDGCTSQNRNATMANALLDLAIKENMLITQKYLEKGHTQMECNSVHSVIETKIKNTDIYLPNQYATLTKDAKKKNPKYDVKYLSFNFFKDFTQLVRYQSIRPGKKTGDPTVTDLRQLNYEPTGKIRYKLLFSDELHDLPSRPKLIDNCELKPLYTERIPIKRRKWKDLQDLKAILPKDFHSFYDTLPKTD